MVEYKMKNETLEEFRETIKQLGIMDIDDTTEFLQLMEKYWIGFGIRNHTAS